MATQGRSIGAGLAMALMSLTLLSLSLVSLPSCIMPKPTSDLLAPTEAQMKLRSYQSRAFDTGDRMRAMRGVIAALQDLGFILERANYDLGLVSGAKFDGIDLVAVMVTVMPEGPGRVRIRANAVHNNRVVDDPEAYQKFFVALQRSLFLDGR